MKTSSVFAASAALALAAVWALTAADQGNEEALWRHRNIGKALFETPTSMAQAPAELKKALDLAPDSFRDRLNYGLALLRAGDLEKAISVLEKAQQQSPENPHTYFNLGIGFKRAGRYEDAQRQFERMVQLVPDEPVSHYNLGLLYDLAGHGADAMKQFEIAAKLNPRMVAPRFQIFNHYRLKDDEAAAAKALAVFQKVKQEQQEANDSEDMEWSYYAELYDPTQAHPPSRVTTKPAPVKFADRKLPGTVDPATANLLPIDADGDGTPDLLAWSRTGIHLYLRAATPVANSGLEGIRDVNFIAPGDFDNDGLVDLCVLTASGPSLYRNTRGHFQLVKADLPQRTFTAAVFLDFDHDYDADLFLFGKEPALLRNEGPATFRDYTAHFPFAPDVATSAAAFRVIPDTKSADLAVAYQGHAAVLYRDELRGEFKATPLDAVPAGATRLRVVDINNDGQFDLAFDTPQGVGLAINRDGKFDAQSTKATLPFTFADLENRGLSDLIGNKAVYRNQGVTEFAAPAMPPGFASATALAHADFNNDGQIDIAAVAPDGTVHVLENRTQTKHQWIRIALTGVKNMKSGEGTEIEVKAGDLYQKKLYEGVPLTFGLGTHTTVDTVRISWPNGLIQNQPNEAAGKAISVKEAPRLSGSCPMIFTWNGHGFEFITDVLGVAPLGAGSGDGEYFPVDHDEYVSIPSEALVEQNGEYQVRITEELHEVSYLDQVRLFALDHPAGTAIYTNEKFKSPPFSEFRLYGVTNSVHPKSATDDRGRDVLANVLHRDRSYAGGFTHDFAGVAQQHTLTLDFGDAARANNAILVLNGWVDWADGSTFVGASQGTGHALVFPYLQVKDAKGRWRTVVEDMGIPAGKPKTMVVDLTGKFLSDSREVRIVTNLCVYWDEIFLSEGTATPPHTTTPVDAATGSLRLRGFSTPTIDAHREQPESFDYTRWTPNATWNQTPGFYTRYGDVRELVAAIDDRLVIMGAGDELQLRFPAAGLPVLKPGWKRDFLLLVDGWAKDADANTAFSQTVEPLPFHGMSAYPYKAQEKFPDDAAHNAWRKKYNTRPAIRLVPRLSANR